MDDPARRIAALDTWRAYRRWVATSAHMKRRRDLWRRAVLWLGVLGLVLGPLAGLKQSWIPVLVARGITLASGIAVALAAYLSREVLGADPDVGWVRARQAAEGLKSLALAFVMRASPFDVGDEAAALEAKRARIEDALELGVALPISEAEAERGFPPFPLIPDAYVTVRAREQQQWFERKVIENHRTAFRLDVATKVLGALAAVLAVPAASWPVATGWIGVLTAAGGALAAQLTAGRYRFLESRYHHTSVRIARIVLRWQTSDRGSAEQARLVEDCERVLREENAGWVAEMLRKEGTAAPVRAARDGDAATAAQQR